MHDIVTQSVRVKRIRYKPILKQAYIKTKKVNRLKFPGIPAGNLEIPRTGIPGGLASMFLDEFLHFLYQWRQE